MSSNTIIEYHVIYQYSLQHTELCPIQVGEEVCPERDHDQRLEDDSVGGEPGSSATELVIQHARQSGAEEVADGEGGGEHPRDEGLHLHGGGGEVAGHGGHLGAAETCHHHRGTAEPLGDERGADGVEVGREEWEVGGGANEEEADEHEEAADNGDEPGGEDLVTEVAHQGSGHHRAHGHHKERHSDQLDGEV